MEPDRKEMMEALGRELTRRRILEKQLQRTKAEMDRILRRGAMRDQELRNLRTKLQVTQIYSDSEDEVSNDPKTNTI